MKNEAKKPRVSGDLLREGADVKRPRLRPRDATNVILNTFYGLGYDPRLSLSREKEKGTICIAISLEIEGALLSFHYNKGGGAVKYKLFYPCRTPLKREEMIELYRSFRTDESICFSSLNDDEAVGISILGERCEEAVTPMLLECMVEEILSMDVIAKIKSIIEKQ